MRSCLSVWLGGILIWLLSLGPVAAATQLTWLDTPNPKASGFETAMTQRDWQFPQDFGAHPGYQTEWWYYTGNLATPEGRPFGFQLTFFRQALAAHPGMVPGASDWRGQQIYSAHFTVSDIEADRFYPTEQFSRGQLGLAGAAAAPYHVWLNTWSATELAPGQVQLQADTEGVAIDLLVNQTKPPVLQGDRGLSIKGQEPGNASYYYSLVQQPTTGTVTIQHTPYTVSGLTWQDHEFSTSSLSAGTVGWDWFSLQFEHGAALMLYTLRHEDGSLEPTSAGTFVAADGSQHSLSSQDWQIQVRDRWKSPTSGAVYPASWEMTIPRLELHLQAKPLMANQELNTSTATYWEGAVTFTGKQADNPIAGQGYVELTGYADRLDRLLGNSA